MFVSMLRRGLIVGLVLVFFSGVTLTAYAEQKTETSMTVELTRKIEPGSEPGAEQPNQPEQVSEDHTIKVSQPSKYNKVLPQLGATKTNLLVIGLLLVILVLIRISKTRMERMYENEEK